MQSASFVEKETAKFGLAKPRCLRQHRLEYWRELARRTGNDLQHLGGGGQLLHGLIALAGEPCDLSIFVFA